ncbi:MAG: hypothetical protein DCF18_06445 [Cyanobium sp.]|nr:MAG: hypothetical protein DCF18_06445 [Cyanobium sp.]
MAKTKETKEIQETYSFFYQINFTNESGDSFTVESRLGKEIQLDEPKESNNGKLTIGETVTPSDGKESYTYTGYSYEGYPIFVLDVPGSEGGKPSKGAPEGLDPGRTYVLATNDELVQFKVEYKTSSSTEPLVLCLVEGASVRLADGSSKDVAALEVGDEVLTPSGTHAVRFVGQTTRTLWQLRSTGRMPIFIEAGALGSMGPEQAIHCTPSHAFLIEGCLVEAQGLINGRTIRQLEQWHAGTVTYYSIELERHALVWANGLLCETYFATARGNQFSRESWDNFSAYQALYGNGAAMVELALPRIPFARQLPVEIRQRLVAGAPSRSEKALALR